MKKIISVFLILSLVSGCDKANTLKPIQPVKNNTIVVEKTVEVEKVLIEKEKIPSAVRFVLNHPYVSAVFAIAVMFAGGNLAYRWFKLKEKRSNLNVKDEPNVEPIQPVNEPEVEPKTLVSVGISTNLDVKDKPEVDLNDINDINNRADEWLGWYCQKNGLNFGELLSLHHSTSALQVMFLKGASDPDNKRPFQYPVFYSVLFSLLSSCNNSVPAKQFDNIAQNYALISELNEKNVVDVPDLNGQFLSAFQDCLSAAKTLRDCVSSCFIPDADKVAEAVHIYLDYINSSIQFFQRSVDVHS